MSVPLRLYRLMVSLLPPPVRTHDGAEICDVFAEQLRGTPRRRAVIWRAFRRFPALLVAEWLEHMRAGRLPAAPRRRRGLDMEMLWRMVRQGARSLARTPAFSLSVVLLLGLGVGSVSAIFAVVDHVLLRELPYPSADRLFVVENGAHSMPTFRDMQAMRSVDQWAAASSNEANLTGEGEPLRVLQAVVSADFFGMFGGRPALGRLLGANDAGSVVLSYGTWQRVFGGDEGILGRTIRIDDAPLTIVGVLDGDFAPPEALVEPLVDMWRAVDPAEALMNDRNYWAFWVAGRLAPGASLADAEREAATLAAERAKLYPDHYLADGEPMPLPVRELQDATIGGVRSGLGLLLGAVTLLLLVACANVTHLFLARGITRVREMSVRRSLGASTRALVAQLFTESMMLGLAGCAIGVGLAQLALRAFMQLVPEGLPRSAAVQVDVRVLLFAAGIGILTTLVFGLLPATRLARGNLGNPLRSGSRNITAGRSAHALRNAIVVMEVALSLVLVAQAGWLLRSFIRLTNEELGFRTAGVVTMPMSVPGIEEPSEWYRRMEAVRQQLAATPGVQQAAFGTTMPLEWTGGGRCCWGQRPDFGGRQLDGPSALHPVSEEYFELIDLQLVAGRSWSRARAAVQPYPAVITEATARAAYGDAAAAIGRTFRVNSGDGALTFEVTGVATDNRHYGADTDYGTAVYLPVQAMPYAPGRVHMAVRTSVTDAGMHAQLRQAVWRAEPKLPVPTIRSLQEWSRESAARQRFESTLFTLFGMITLLLVAGGLAGTLFYMVSLQRRDLGIRLALGATAAGVERVVLTRGLGLAAIGVLLGAGAAWASGRLLESRLHGVDARDPGTLGVAVAVLMTIALLSSWIPARRAAATNPVESLRAE